MTDAAPITSPFTSPSASPAVGDEELGDLLLEVLPADGGSLGNQTAREALSRAAEREISAETHETVKEKALALGLIRKGRGRGGASALKDGFPAAAAALVPPLPQCRLVLLAVIGRPPRPCLRCA